MADLVTRVGNLTRDPELSFTNSGKAVANFTIAHQPYNPETKERGEAVFIEVSAWEDMAEHVVESLSKGDRVIVEGVPSINKWKDKDTGEERMSRRISAVNLGPELRFVTATINKKSTPAPTGRNPWAAPNDPWAEMADDSQPDQATEPAF